MTTRRDDDAGGGEDAQPRQTQTPAAAPRTETVTLECPPEMADALAWAFMCAGPGRPPCVLPYRYGPDGAKRPAVKEWARWHGGSGPLWQPVAMWRDWARYAHRTRVPAWAVLPGALGVVVVDVDAPHLLGQVLDAYGETEVVVLTPRGGYHLYYQAGASPPITRTGVLGPGTYDVKSVGGTAHAPGSARPDGGRYVAEAPGLEGGVLRYEGGSAALSPGTLYRAMPVFPSAMLDEIWAANHAARDDLPLDGEPRYVDTPGGRAALRAYVSAAGPARSGNAGHDHTFKLLRKIGDLGASEDLALVLALEWDEGNEPPWGPTDIRKKVRDAYRTRQSPVGWRIEELGTNAGCTWAAVASDPDADMSTDELVALMREAHDVSR